MHRSVRGLAAGMILGLATTASAAEPVPKVGERLARVGDEIVVCGQLFHTTAPVVLWTDPGGYDAYRVERRFVPLAEAGWKTNAPNGTLKSPARFTLRRDLPADLTARVRGGGWSLPALQGVVDQFVIHFDVCGTSKKCFEVLHDQRGLSVQFMLDIDGTIYQTLDAKEGAFHATKANGRSIGIEIANIGTSATDKPDNFDRWYEKTADGTVRIKVPADADLHNKAIVPRPIRPEPVVGPIQGRDYKQYDLTPEQYDSLIKLTATLCTIFPKIKCEAPRDPDGKVTDHALPNEVYNSYQGVMGHYHVQTNKNDPGPAFQWDKVINGAKTLMAR